MKRHRFNRPFARNIVGPCALAVVMVFFQVTGQVQSSEPANQLAEKNDDNTLVRTLFDGKSLANWRIIKQNDFQRHGKVFVQDRAVVMEKGKPASGIAYTGKIPQVNYQISLEAKRLEGSDFFCGLTFPVNKSHCTLIIGGWGGGATGLSNVDGSSAEENETSGYTAFKNDRWYNIRLRVTATRIEAWIDDRQIVDLDSRDRQFSIWWEQEPARPLGIATWHTSAAVRRIRLTSIQPVEQRGQD